MASDMPALKIMGGLIEARSVATGEAPAARIHVNGHAYVPATTHQRTVEALREAEKAIRNAYGAITSGQTEDKDAAGTLRAALARIKEPT